jgi:twitching motility protein PilU
VDINKLLTLMAEKGASDAFITADAPPSIKLNGKLMPVGPTALTADQAKEVILSVMTEDQRHEFLDSHECNFAINGGDLGRFRASAFFQRNQAEMVLRRIETKIPRVEDLQLPIIINELAMTKRGLIIFVGATGTGKSTSLAAMLGYRNRNSHGHIISIEDPIEFVHEHEGCIVSQREVGIDTESYDIALKNTLRQAPDVIMIGEVRTRETMEQALTFAETGHLCLCTLHANNANQALDRILHFFPTERHAQVWMDLSLNLKAMIAQQLVPIKDGSSRRAVVEIMINTPRIADLIREGEVHKIKEVMSKSTELGMCTFDQALFSLYQQGLITNDEALKHADSANDLRLMIKLDGENGSPFDSIPKGLSIEEQEDSGTLLRNRGPLT